MQYFELILQAAHRNQKVEGNEMISDHRTQNWFKHFKSGNMYLEIKPRSGHHQL